MSDDEIYERLIESRPGPRAVFVEALDERLQEKAGPGRPQIVAQILAYTGSGGALLAVAVLGAAGAGPLAP